MEFVIQLTAFLGVMTGAAYCFREGKRLHESGAHKPGCWLMALGAGVVLLANVAFFKKLS